MHLRGFAGGRHDAQAGRGENVSGQQERHDETCHAAKRAAAGQL
jgi:hypothetical protein